jgi:hypothetical protein
MQNTRNDGTTRKWDSIHPKGGGNLEVCLMRKIRAMREEILTLDERRTPPTERDTDHHQQNKRSGGEVSMQTPNDNEQPENRTKGGAAEMEKEEMKSTTA